MIDLDQYRQIVEQAPDAIIMADAKGLIRIWNAKAVEVFGFEYPEAYGQSLDLIVPEKLRKAHWKGFNLAMENGYVRQNNKILTTRSIHKSGKTIYVNLTFSILKDDLGLSLGALAFGREFTEQYLKEKAKLTRLAELEDNLSKGKP